MNIFAAVVLGWLWRRVKELAGWLAMLVPLYLGMPAEQQKTILAILTGQGGELSLAAAGGLLWYLWTQRESLLKTIRPQIVTPQGARIELDQLTPAAQHDVLVTAAQAKPRRTIASAVLDGLIDKLNRSR